MKSKRCPSCGQGKPEDEFGRNKSLGDGLSFYCLECNRAKSNEHYRKRRRAMGKPVRDHSWVPAGFQWCPKCKQALEQAQFDRSRRAASGFSSWCKACKRVVSSDAYFYRTYGLTRQELSQLRTAQQDRCAICGDASPRHLDHDHSTGRTRRLLCQRCNHGLGLFRDEPYLLRVAALYIEGHRQMHANDVLRQAASDAEAASRPGEPPVGSQRRPGTRSTSTRSTGRSSGSRRRKTAGEADE